MEFEWGEAKRRRNFEKHKIDFIDVAELFDCENAVRIEDKRRDYGEQRLILLCDERGQLFHITFTLRGQTVRTVSARPGNRKERRRYEEEQKQED